MPYAELLEFNQPNLIRKKGFTKIRDQFEGLQEIKYAGHGSIPEDAGMDFYDEVYDPERIVEFAGRWDYGEKNAQKLGNGEIIERWMNSGEESMIEMAHATFFVECSRVVSHEFVRHRLFSFQQESQRFTKYDDKKSLELFYLPPELAGRTDAANLFTEVYDDALRVYKHMRERSIAPQLARYVLPNAMLTRMIVSGNMREWRHFLKLRTHKSVQPEMRELALMIYDQLAEVFPTLTKGIISDERATR